MKICPRCLERFGDEEEVCPEDGTRLRHIHTEKRDPMVGRVLDDRWLIEAKIGEGGMGAVYRAQQTSVDRQVAIKTLRSELVSSEDYVERFFREANVASSINHPHCVTLFDFGQTADDHLLFLAMEYLEGQPLTRCLRRANLSLREILTVGKQICSALAAAHASQIVHRDLKPDNVFLVDVPGDEIFVKVLDFGIAKILDADTTRVTKTGQIFGTPEYMSPEQCISVEVDARSDLYSLGIILYELLSGRSPFHSDTPLKTLLAQVNKEVKPPSSYGIDVPRGIEELVMRLLAKEPEDRFSTALEVREALVEQLTALADYERADEPIGATSTDLEAAGSDAETTTWEGGDRDDERRGRAEDDPAKPPAEFPRTLLLADLGSTEGEAIEEEVSAEDPRPSGPTTLDWLEDEDEEDIRAFADSGAVTGWGMAVSTPARQAAPDEEDADDEQSDPAVEVVESEETEEPEAASSEDDEVEQGVSDEDETSPTDDDDASAAPSDDGEDIPDTEDEATTGEADDEADPAEASDDEAAAAAWSQLAVAAVLIVAGFGVVGALLYATGAFDASEPDARPESTAHASVRDEAPAVTAADIEAARAIIERSAGEADIHGAATASADGVVGRATLLASAEPKAKAGPADSKPGAIRRITPKPPADTPPKGAGDRPRQAADSDDEDEVLPVLTPTGISRIIRKHNPAIRSCFQKGLLQDPDFAGTVSLRIVISPKGEVTAADTPKSTLDSKVVESCLTKLARGWKFPESMNGSATIHTESFTYGRKSAE